MTGEQIFFRYQDSGPADYANVLMSIYMAIGDKLFPLLIKAEADNKKLAVKPYNIDDVIRDINEDDILFN